ncbi:hypothetical protein SIPHO059v1_p0087 [Vibrio phage 264E42.1]|nr:hypothetical protein SIPHO059v1_p0087 [Vibrio phage 264E42.1]
MKYTREQFINKECTGSEYYRQFVTEGYLNKVASYIGRDRIVASTCPNFSDIPLKEWDSVSAPLGTNEAMHRLGDYLTLSGMVCIAKEAARQIRAAAKQ